MRGRLVVVGMDLVCSLDGAADARIPLTELALEPLRGWRESYRRAVEYDEPGLLVGVGRGLLGWLDADGSAARWLRGAGERVLEVAVDTDAGVTSRLLLDLPWELLADERGFLAADATQPLVVFRGLARAAGEEPALAGHRDLAVMFMAASPEGQQVLDFEAEESAILAATERLAVHVAVEESGCAALLKDRLAREAEAFEVVHVSCHGTVLAGVPVLALETLEGELELVEAGAFAAVLGERKPPLVFVSACRTAESESGFTEPFVRALVRSGVRNVLGWDGSVYDSDASRFARTLYGELAEHASVPFAAAAARRDLLLAHLEDPRVGRHWHLARVYAGPGGGGACCAAGMPKRRVRRHAGAKDFLDKANGRVAVASAGEFVGRRRQVQAVLRAFRDGAKAGVLVWGMGNLGKSSLAARVANRAAGYRTVVVYDRYDARAIFARIVAALPAGERSACERAWGKPIAHDPSILAHALEELLEGPFDAHPILLIVDDLEQILATPTPGQARTPVRDADGTVDAWRAALGGVLRAFAAASSDSRLLLTSRYDFTLPDGQGRDLSDLLERVPLRPMDDDERAKQWRAAARAAGQSAGDDAAQSALVTRAQAEAGGNPGLQEILCRPILSGELAAAHAAVDAVAHWKATGEVPAEENAAQEFFRRVSFQTYRNALSDHEVAQLRAATLFSEGLPVPVAALEAAGAAVGVPDPPASVRRLIALGLVDDWTEVLTRDTPRAAVNALARPLAGAPLTEPETSHVAGAVTAVLASAWRDEDGDYPFDARGVEAARLALAANAPPETLDRTAYAAATFLFRVEHNARAGLQFLAAAIEAITAQQASPRPELLGLAADCAERIGENHLGVQLLEQGLAQEGGDPVARALLAVRHASATIAIHGPEQALETLHRAAAVLDDAGDIRARAVTMGKIADILGQRGETEEALRIRREEELPVYERLGDIRERAVTMGKIADILGDRGETEEALRIHREEELPVYERLGDIRSRAVTMGKIADILRQRGETEEALRIRREEQLPVYERLGDIRSRAVTMGQIADILRQRGETEEALRIRREEELPVYERLGDIRSRAVTMGKIADILRQRGETEEALRIRREEQLPVFERLGDIRSRAVTMGKIADILGDRGETEEALRIRREEELPVFERLGDIRSRAVTMGKIADILGDRGETEEALRIRREEELPVYERLGDIRERAVTMGKIADILRQRGETEEALRIRREEELPVYERLGDIRERAVTMGKIADILGDRGETEEALRIHREEQLPVYERLGDIRSRAVTMGKIADILRQRGETEEALRIRREEQLPVYERLGDIRSRAVTMGQIADILRQRGETEEALRIRREEQLPVFERLGDIRSRAVTMGKIADILRQRGETEEALRIRREEQLPVFERLGDIRSRAVTMGKIADILGDRGETEEALRIRREEELPVYERLGDIRSRAVTMGKIADILGDRGETEEALRIRREEELPVYERLGDIRERAVTMGKIADILAQRGETDEALRIHIEDRLPVAQRMHDTDSIAHVRLACAQLRIKRGGLGQEEAQVIADELSESFTLWRQLQRADGIAIAGALLGQVLAAAGAQDAATPILTASADAFDRLGQHEQAAQMRAFAQGA